MRLVVAACFAVALFGSARAAKAQPRFGDVGQFAVSAEDLFGYYSETESWDTPPTGTANNTTNRFSFLFNSRADGPTTFAAPKVGGHYFVIPSLSVGGTLGFESRGGSTGGTVNGATVTHDKFGSTTFMLMPKVGYALMLTDMLGFWFRGGPGFATQTVHTSATDDRLKTSDTFWMLSLDALFVVSPVPHWGFYVGPGADISFAGTRTSTDPGGPMGAIVETSVSASYHRLFLGAGMLGYF